MNGDWHESPQSEHNGGSTPKKAKWLSLGPGAWESKSLRGACILQCEAPKIAKLVYNSNIYGYGLWYL